MEELRIERYHRGAGMPKEHVMDRTYQKAYKGAGMEGWIARWYARTRQNEMEDFRERARAIAARLRGAQGGCEDRFSFGECVGDALCGRVV